MGTLEPYRRRGLATAILNQACLHEHQYDAQVS
jgi:hypothetical protein